MKNKSLKIGMFGFGCVGQGLYDIITNDPSLHFDIVKIAIKNKEKTRPIHEDIFTYDKYEVLNNPEIDLVVELIDDAAEAFNIVKYALQNGKSVVTANKKMVANNLEELFTLQSTNNVSLLYEASCCGSIPIIRSLEDYFGNETIFKLRGIFNGTTNYILTKMVEEGESFEKILAIAQEKGFAETDPTSDIEAYDPRFKTCILAFHAFGGISKPEDVFAFGINTLTPADIQYAKSIGHKIKLVPQVHSLNNDEICMFVLPKLIPPTDRLYTVDNEFNGVILNSKFSDEQFFYGRGAGGHPTGAAVLSDIIAFSENYKYSYKKSKKTPNIKNNNNVLIKVLLRYNKDEDLNNIPFHTIENTFTIKNSKFVTGFISITGLLNSKTYLCNSKLFIAQVGEEVILRQKKAETHYVTGNT